MDFRIPDEKLLKLSASIAGMMGINFPRGRWRDLASGIDAAAREFGGDTESCIEAILSAALTKKQIGILARHLAVGETYFFRDKQLFSALAEHILPGLIRLRRSSMKHIRIWSAGCSSGEEPYSIAILLSKAIPDLRDWDITIRATDINLHALEQAEKAQYGNWSFRGTRPEIKERYFKKTGDGRFELVTGIRQMVAFSFHNLIETACSSPVDRVNTFDIIICRNVLMYFDPENVSKVVRNLSCALSEDGCFIVSPSEAGNPAFSRFTPMKVCSSILYRSRASSKGSPLATGIPQSAAYRASMVQPSAAAPLSIAQPALSERTTVHAYGTEQPEGREEARPNQQLPRTRNRFALLASTYANRGDLGKALACCERAIRFEKLSAGHHYLMATILQELGRMEEAVDSLKKTLYLDPGFIPAYVAMGSISRKAGRRKESLKHLENALSLLRARSPAESLPEMEGINAERLTEMINAIKLTEDGRLPE